MIRNRVPVANRRAVKQVKRRKNANLSDMHYLGMYIKVDKEVMDALEKHYKRYPEYSEVCAWYRDWEDFCSDWCDEIGYTRTQARKLLHGGKGEFMILPKEKGIVRFTE